MKTGISLAEATALVQEGLAPLGAEELPLQQGLGRVLARDVIAPLDQPPFDRSPLDGYALRAAGTAGACPDHPVSLEVVDTVYAGDVARVPVGPGQAVRVMTGAMLPPGCDCVLRQEDTDQGHPVVSIRSSLHCHDNYCFRGEDYAAGTLLLPAGTPMDAAAAGLLASAGLDRAPVGRLPSVCILSTGDEVVAPSVHPLPPGKIYASNGDLLLARLAELGIRDTRCALLPDDPEAVARAMGEAAAQYDLVLTTGGVSVGVKDILHTALPLLGAEQVFWKVMVKPGTPVMFSRYGGKPILSLSGNPFAAAVNFELLARPILAALAGDARLLPRPCSAVLDTPFAKGGNMRRFLRGRYAGGHITLPDGHSSGQLASLVGCNCLVDIPAGRGPLAPGAGVDALLL